MPTIQARLLPALAELRLFDSWPETTVPMHLVFGEDDILTPPSLVEAASRLLKPDDSLSCCLAPDTWSTSIVPRR